jgi:activating signal cointegrator 1
VKALPVWQPWASLIAMGVKRNETRAYPPKRLGLRDGQRIAIHAAKTDQEIYRCGIPPFSRYVPLQAELPLGAIVAVVTLQRGRLIDHAFESLLSAHAPVEHAFGDYTLGRYAWVLRDVEKLPIPIPIRGQQGTFTVPDELLTAQGIAV